MPNLMYEYEPIDFQYDNMGTVAGAAVDSRGNIFAMTCAEDMPVTVFDPKGRFLYGWGRGLIGGCHGIYIDRDDFVYVADSGDHVVSKFTNKGELIFTIGTRGVPSDSGCVGGNFKTIRRGAGPFYSPSKVTVSPRGDIFVCDGYGNARIHRFSPDGVLIRSWGEPGGGPGEFRIPHGAGVGENGLVYVADRENSRVQVFDEDGNLQAIWNDIHRPDGLCVANGLVYVAELGYRMYVDNVLFTPWEGSPWSQVRVFDPSGAEQARFGGPEGWVAGNLYAAHGINVDAQGNIYVSEAGWPENEQPKPAGLHKALQKFRLI